MRVIDLSSSARSERDPKPWVLPHHVRRFNAVGFVEYNGEY